MVWTLGVADYANMPHKPINSLEVTIMQLPRFDNTNVLVIGDAMLDRYWHGDANRVSAEAPVPIVNVSETEDRPGGAANVALNIVALGGRASLVCAVGSDDESRILRNKLETAGIKCLFLEDKDYRTTTKLRIISKNQQLIRADFEEIREADQQAIFELVKSGLEGVQAIVLSDYDKGVITDPGAIIKLAGEKGIPVLVDPKYKDFSLYKGSTVVKPNRAELSKAIGGWKSEDEMVSKCKKLILDLNIDALLVTRDMQGMTLIQGGDEQEVHIPAHSREVYDTSGAGDTVISVFAASVAATMSFAEAARLANIGAGIAVSHLGVVSVSGPELRLEIASEEGFDQGIMANDQVKLVIEASRARGEKIVFTNGCFDILHAGHVDYLKEAKQLGDRLVVAVDSDESVRRLKGEGRPINPLDRRMILLASLSVVDWVVSFADDEALNALLTEIKPNFLAKGGDYSIDQVVGADIVRSHGGEVKVVSLVEDCSTSAMVEKIRKI